MWTEYGVAQRCAIIIRSEYAFGGKDRDNIVEKPVDSFGHVGRRDDESVTGAGAKPVSHVACDLTGRAHQREMPARSALSFARSARSAMRRGAANP
jgi:hypothetical protein